MMPRHRKVSSTMTTAPLLSAEAISTEYTEERRIPLPKPTRNLKEFQVEDLIFPKQLQVKLPTCIPNKLYLKLKILDRKKAIRLCLEKCCCCRRWRPTCYSKQRRCQMQRPWRSMPGRWVCRRRELF